MKKTKTKLFLGIIIALFFFSCEDQIEKPVVEPSEPYWNFRVWDPNYKQYYLQNDILYFSLFSVTDNGTSFLVKINLNQTFNADYVIKRKLNDKWEVPDYGGDFLSIIKKGPAVGKESTEIIRTDLVFGVFDDEKLIYEAPLTVTFYPQEYYAANNNLAPGYLIFHKYDKSEIPFFRTPESWSIVTPTKKERAFALKEWGGLISGIDDPLEQARLIQLDIINKLHKYQGVPSPELISMSPFDQYKKLLKGKDRLWCAGWSYIFIRALSCFDIPARQAYLASVMDGASVPNLLFAEGHSAVGVYNKNENIWKYVDLNFNMIDMEYQNRSLNIFDLHYMLNNPKYLKELYVTEYDPENYRENKIRLIESKNYPAYLNYYKVNQKIWF